MSDNERVVMGWSKGTTQAVLDHGYVKLVDWMGTDEDIVEAARMSTDKGFVSWEPYEKHPRGDFGLLDTLFEMQHATPFEMCELVIEVQAPIMVFREWHRHRTQSYNEMSARYTPLPDVNYVPTVERLLRNSKTNKQAGVVAGAAELTEREAEAYRARLIEEYDNQERLYQAALKMGVPKELARAHVGVGRMSRMRAKTDLRNWLAFETLRWDEAAQWEIQQYAGVVASIIRSLWPRTWSLYMEYVKNAVRFSGTEIAALRRVFKDNFRVSEALGKMLFAEVGLDERRIGKLLNKLEVTR